MITHSNIECQINHPCKTCANSIAYTSKKCPFNRCGDSPDGGPIKGLVTCYYKKK
jgi:hypothetical protein